MGTPEVAAAKAEFNAAYAAAEAAAAAERKRREAQVINGLPLAGLSYGAIAPVGLSYGAVAPAALGAPLAYNTAVSAPGAAREAVLTTIKLNPGHATFYRVD